MRAYEIKADGIEVIFSDGWHYLYTNQSAGPGNVLELKKRAGAGVGLNSFINTNVKQGYSKKWH